MSERLVTRINQTLTHLDHGGMQCEEVVEVLGRLHHQDHSGDLLSQFPPERHPILLAAFAESLQRTADEDCLEPPTSVFITAPANTVSMLGLAEYLLDALAEPFPLPLLRAVCLPSFSPPWAVRLVKPYGWQSGDPCRLIHATILGGGSEFEGGAREVVRRETPIHEVLSHRLAALWDRMISNVRVPKLPRRGADGVTWHFTNRTEGGQVWSPARGSLPWRLAVVAQTLAKLSTSDPAETSVILEALNRDMQAFGL